jgi:hypothetical protein
MTMDWLTKRVGKTETNIWSYDLGHAIMWCETCQKLQTWYVTGPAMLCPGCETEVRHDG